MADEIAEHLDVVIVGAGISGIGAAWYLRHHHPHRTVVVLEARDAIGGTWDLFRYPGIRSDSDLYTFGYAFKPWIADDAIAGGEAILAYLRDTVAEAGIGDEIRFHRRVVGASWSSAEARWSIEVEHLDDGRRSTLTSSWLFFAGGYYRYDAGYTPSLPGLERFGGVLVHPQQWPEDLDVTGRRVVVVGSGATAVTLVPALALTAGHVTMLQRTPTYILPIPTRDRLALGLRRVLGDERAHRIVRRKNIARQRATWRFARRHPSAARRFIRWVNVRELPDGYPVDVDFRPPYEPWDQRLCLAADGDFFRAIREGSASVVTDQIETFTETGIRLRSGGELTADVVITATGLVVQAMAGMTFEVDGEPVRGPETMVYKGMMLSGVPNFAFAVGYTNASWTLKVELLCEHLCRLLDYQDEHGYAWCVPRPTHPGMPTRPFLDFAAGYVARAVDELPRQGDRWPWLASTTYRDDVRRLRHDSVVDPELHWERAGLTRATGQRSSTSAATTTRGHRCSDWQR